MLLESISDVLEDYIEASGARNKVNATRLKQEWSAILESPLSDHLKIGSFEDGHLLILASDPSWSQEASYQKRQIRETINDYFDDDLVESIRIKH